METNRILGKINSFTLKKYIELRKHLVKNLGDTKYSFLVEPWLGKSDFFRSINLQIVTNGKISEDRYGIVLATNIQEVSHYYGENKQGLFLLTHLCFSDGEKIDSLSEIDLLSENFDLDNTLKSLNEFADNSYSSFLNNIDLI